MSVEESLVSRDFDPTPGQWYEDLDREETFKVLAVDPDDATVRLQWLNGEVEELDVEAWNELDLEKAEEPEGWVDDDEDEEGDDEDLDEEDWEDDEDDDWDDDEDEDYDDEDDEYRDRE
jgi:hypothetical protein